MVREKMFSTPAWLRDLGFASWLLAGFVVIIVGVIWLLNETSTIVMPVVLAGVLGAVATPLVDRLQGRGASRAPSCRSRTTRRRASSPAVRRRSREATRSARAAALETAVATSSVKSPIRVSVSAGNGSARVVDAAMTPQRRPSTLIGQPTDARMPRACSLARYRPRRADERVDARRPLGLSHLRRDARALEGETRPDGKLSAGVP